MKTLNKTLTASLFTDAEGYEKLKALWSGLMRDAEAREQLTRSHHLLYLILRGKDWKKAFTPPTNTKKIENGGLYAWGRRRAILELLDETRNNELFAPFVGLVKPDALEAIRALVAAPDWRDLLMQGDSYLDKEPS